MKRIISIILAVVLVIMPAGVISGEDSGILDSVLNKLAEYTTEQRDGYISYFRPFITTDTGVSAALLNLDSGAMDGMIQEIVGDSVDKPTLRRVFQSFTCIKDETGIRLTYADILQKKIELENASDATLKGMEKLMNVLYKRYPAAEKIFTEDRITAGVVANLFTIIPEINESKPMLKFKDGEFDVNFVSQTFADDFDAVWDGYISKAGKTVTYQQMVDTLVTFLNSKVPHS